MSDCLILGGGVIGLSLAYELAGQAEHVLVIDRGEPGRESSWAGVGIFPPASPTSDDPLEQLTRLSNDLHAQWAQALLEQTGIDNQYRRCGCIYLARDGQTLRDLQASAALWRERQIAVEPLSPMALGDLEPNLQPSGEILSLYFVPDELQVRNPRHIQALLAACAQRGVNVRHQVEAQDFEVSGRRVTGVRTNAGVLAADNVCITSGAWSRALGERIGLPLAVKPMRGQIVLLKTEHPLISRVIYEGARYLVPRNDGRILVGSTVEDVGFDRRTTSEVIQWLLDFAHDTVPALRLAEFERCWAGLRPGSIDGLPYLDRAPNLDNLFVAAGHFRSGLQLSTGTAAVMSQLIRGHSPQIDLTPFRIGRG